MKTRPVCFAIVILCSTHRAYADENSQKPLPPTVKAACHAIADSLRKIPNVKVETKEGASLAPLSGCQVILTGQKDAPPLQSELRAQGWKPDPDFSRMVAIGPSGYTAIMVKDKTDCFIHWQTPIESEDPDEKPNMSVDTSTYTVNCTSKE